MASDGDLRTKVQRLLTELARGTHRGQNPDCSVCVEMVSVRDALALEEHALEDAIREIERLTADIAAHQRTIVVMLGEECGKDEYPSGIDPEGLRREGAKKPDEADAHNEAANIVERALAMGFRGSSARMETGT